MLIQKVSDKPCTLCGEPAVIALDGSPICKVHLDRYFTIVGGLPDVIRKRVAKILMSEDETENDRSENE